MESTEQQPFSRPLGVQEGDEMILGLAWRIAAPHAGSPLVICCPDRVVYQPIHRAMAV